MHKQLQLFTFFQINDVAAFKSQLANDIAPIVTSAAQLANVSTQPLTALNIAFSQSGLTTLGVTDNLNDAAFSAGQVNDINNLGWSSLCAFGLALNLAGETTDAWMPAFVQGVHGVILLASDEQGHIDDQVAFLDSTFAGSVTTVHTVEASVRPGDEAGHEGQLRVPPRQFLQYFDGLFQHSASLTELLSPRSTASTPLFQDRSWCVERNMAPAAYLQLTLLL